MLSPTPLQRRLEPEVMDTAEDAAEYASIDNTAVNADFVARAWALAPRRGRILDIGTGPAEIAIALARRAPHLHVTAIDLGDHMLALAQRNVTQAGLNARVQIVKADAKATGFESGSFDMVTSNSLVHHLPEPVVFLRELRRLLAPGSAVFIKDLVRPDSDETLQRLVRTYAAECTTYQRDLFRDSLAAALTLAEVKEACQRAELFDVTIAQTSDRHWVIERAYDG